MIQIHRHQQAVAVLVMTAPWMKSRKGAKTQKCSTSDPESGWFRKGEHKHVFAYSMTAISVRRIRSLLIGQRTGRVTKNTRAIKASVKTVLIFPNVQKAKSMKKRSSATFGKSIWKPVRISAILSGTKRFIC